VAGSDDTKAETDFGALYGGIGPVDVLVGRVMQLARRGECAPIFANRERRAEDCAPYLLRSHAFEVPRHAVENRI
jgi:hypothetical protein